MERSRSGPSSLLAAAAAAQGEVSSAQAGRPGAQKFAVRPGGPRPRIRAPDGLSAVEMLAHFESRPSIIEQRPATVPGPRPPRLAAATTPIDHLDYIDEMYRQQSRKLQAQLHQGMRDQDVLRTELAELQRLTSLKAQLEQRTVEGAVGLSKGASSLTRMQSLLEQHVACQRELLERCSALQSDVYTLRAAVSSLSGGDGAGGSSSALPPRHAAASSSSSGGCGVRLASEAANLTPLPELEQRIARVEAALRSENDELAPIRETPTTLSVMLSSGPGQDYNPLDALSAIAAADANTGPAEADGGASSHTASHHSSHVPSPRPFEAPSRPGQFCGAPSSCSPSLLRHADQSSTAPGAYGGGVAFGSHHKNPRDVSVSTSGGYGGSGYGAGGSNSREEASPPLKSSRTASLDTDEQVHLVAPCEMAAATSRFSPVPLRHCGVSDVIGSMKL